MATKAELIAKNTAPNKDEFEFVLSTQIYNICILNLVDWSQFSGIQSGFDIDINGVLYQFQFDVGPAMTNETVWNSLTMIIPPDYTPITPLENEEFKVSYQNGKIYVEFKKGNYGIYEYFAPEAMTTEVIQGFVPYTLKFAPDGWETDEYTWERDMDSFGVFRKFVVKELKFPKDGRDYLLESYEHVKGGVNTLTSLTVTQYTPSGVTRNRFIGQIDYSTTKITEISFDCQVIDGAFTDIILSRAKSVVNVFSNKTIDGTVLSPAINTLVTLPDININQIANWEGYDYATVYPGLHYLFLNLINSEYAEANSVVAYGFNLFSNAVEDYVNANFKYKIKAELNGNNSAARFTYDYYISKWVLGVETVVYHGQIFGIGVYPLAVDLDLTEIFTINTGDSLSFRGEINNTIGTATIQYSLVEVKLQTLIANIATRDINMMLYHEAFERVIAHLTGLEGRFKSDAFGRTDIGYAADGSIGALTTGRYVRNEWGLNNTLPLSLESLFKSKQSIRCLGLGIEEIEGVEKVVVEEMPHFFNNQVILNISNRIAAETIVKMVYPEIIFNRIAVGYNSFDYDSLGGLYEFNTTAKFTTIINRVDKELNLIAPYRADMSGVIKLIEESGPNKDVSGDNDIFLLDAIRDGIGGYKVRTSEGFDQAEDLGNRDVLFNVIISPKRNLFRWGSFITGFAGKYPLSEVIYQTSDKNTKLKSTETSQAEVVENSNILVSDLAPPLWYAEIFELEFPMLENDIELIKANLYGLFKITDTEFGWILKYRSHNKNGKSWARLLRCNTNYVIPDGDPVYPATIEIKKVITGLPNDASKFLVNISGDNGVNYTNLVLLQGLPIRLNNVMYGTYTITEVGMPTNYSLISISPNFFTVDGNNLHYYIEVTNERLFPIRYGALYNGYIDFDKIEYNGYFVPTNADWVTLLDNVGTMLAPYYYPHGGNKLKSIQLSGTDDFNFRVQASGFRYNDDGHFEYGVGTILNYLSLIWSKTRSIDGDPFWMWLISSVDVMQIYEGQNKCGASIRLFRPATAEEQLLNDGAIFDEFTDIDGNASPSIKIGTQIWLMYNCRTTHYSDGTLIPTVTDNSAWVALTTGAMCYYNNDPTNA